MQLEPKEQLVKWTYLMALGLMAALATGCAEPESGPIIDPDEAAQMEPESDSAANDAETADASEADSTGATDSTPRAEHLSLVYYEINPA